MGGSNAKSYSGLFSNRRPRPQADNAIHGLDRRRGLTLFPARRRGLPHRFFGMPLLPLGGKAAGTSKLGVGYFGGDGIARPFAAARF